MHEVLKQYFQEVKRLLPCGASEKKRCIMELETDVSAFLDSRPNASIEDLYAAFGTPQSIAESFMARMSAEQLSHRLSVKRKIVIGVIVIAALLAITVGAMAIRIANDVHGIQKGYFTEFVVGDTKSEPPITSETEVY